MLEEWVAPFESQFSYQEAACMRNGILHAAENVHLAECWPQKTDYSDRQAVIFSVMQLCDVWRPLLVDSGRVGFWCGVVWRGQP